MKYWIGLISLSFYLAACTPSTSYDILIVGAEVYDGSGSEAMQQDIGIWADTIAFIGKASPTRVTANRIIDATGLVLCPGFIDPHTHTTSDLSDSVRSQQLNYLFQGVTTVFTGNDGRSPDIEQAFERWEKQGIGTNAASFIGHGSVRSRILGMENRAPTAEELERMKELVRSGMAAGAWGLSTGLFYAPGSYSTTAEVIALAKEVGAQGGVYDSHIRDESTYTVGLLNAVKEVIQIGEEAQLPVHISHIKALGADVWGKSDSVIQLVEAARQQGLNITANQYPYTASSTSLVAATIPRWAEAGGRPSMLKRFQDGSLRKQLLADIRENIRRRGGPESLVMSASSAPIIANKSLEEITEELGLDPAGSVISLLQTHNGIGVISHNMQEADVANFMKQPWVMTGSDGSSNHPRKYGTFPHKIEHYVREQEVLSLAEMIRVSTSFPASFFGIEKRGMIQEGYMADLIIFHADSLRANATFSDPNELSVGMEYVILNGQVVINEGKHRGIKAGKVLRKNEHSF